MILDADDRLRPRALNLLRATLEDDPALGFAYGITRFFGEWEGEMTMPPYDPYKLLYRHTIGTTCLMRRELVAAVGGLRRGLRRLRGLGVLAARARRRAGTGGASRRSPSSTAATARRS